MAHSAHLVSRGGSDAGARQAVPTAARAQSASPPPPNSREWRSLVRITHAFIGLLRASPHRCVNVSQAEKHLEQIKIPVKRRRLSDVINVLEGIAVVEKISMRNRQYMIRMLSPDDDAADAAATAAAAAAAAALANGAADGTAAATDSNSAEGDATGTHNVHGDAHGSNNASGGIAPSPPRRGPELRALQEVVRVLHDEERRLNALVALMETHLTERLADPLARIFGDDVAAVGDASQLYLLAPLAAAPALTCAGGGGGSSSGVGLTGISAGTTGATASVKHVSDAVGSASLGAASAPTAVTLRGSVAADALRLSVAVGARGTRTSTHSGGNGEGGVGHADNTRRLSLAAPAGTAVNVTLIQPAGVALNEQQYQDQQQQSQQDENVAGAEPASPVSPPYPASPPVAASRSFGAAVATRHERGERAPTRAAAADIGSPAFLQRQRESSQAPTAVAPVSRSLGLGLGTSPSPPRAKRSAMEAAGSAYAVTSAPAAKKAACTHTALTTAAASQTLKPNRVDCRATVVTFEPPPAGSDYLFNLHARETVFDILGIA